MLYQLEIEVLNLGTFSVPKWHILQEASTLSNAKGFIFSFFLPFFFPFLLSISHSDIFSQKDSKDSNPEEKKEKVKGLTKVFGGPKLNLDNVKEKVSLSPFHIFNLFCFFSLSSILPFSHFPFQSLDLDLRLVVENPILSSRGLLLGIWTQTLLKTLNPMF